ncbi:MAG: hypothetical protein PGN15_01635 [Aeromicrobium erythreum]
MVGSVGAVVAWAAYLRGFSDENGVRGWPDALDSMVDLGSSTAALALAALLVVAGSATARRQPPGIDDGDARQRRRVTSTLTNSSDAPGVE